MPFFAVCNHLARVNVHRLVLELIGTNILTEDTIENEHNIFASSVYVRLGERALNIISNVKLFNFAVGGESQEKGFYELIDFEPISEENIIPSAFDMTVTEAPNFFCPVGSCGLTFNSASDLRVHYRSLTLIKPFKCVICQENFSFLRSIALHLTKDHSKSHFESFIKVSQDLLAAESEKLMIFDEKIETFLFDLPEPSPPQLSPFSEVRLTSNNKFVCPFPKCEKIKETKRSLIDHYRLHCEDFKPYVCRASSDCFYRSSYSSNIIRHIQQAHFHSESVPRAEVWSFVQVFQSWIDNENTLFAGVKRLASTTKQFPCTFLNCEKFFANDYYLKKHMLTHTKKNHLYCKCGKTAEKHNLMSHIISVHYFIPTRKQKSITAELKKEAEKWLVDNKIPSIPEPNVHKVHFHTSD